MLCAAKNAYSKISIELRENLRILPLKNPFYPFALRFVIGQLFVVETFSESYKTVS